MPNYTKLFNSIVTSTIWTEDDKTRIVWITMLALADQNGEVQSSIPGLARLAGVAIADVEAALEKFLSPDAYSRTPDNDGRRIAKIEGGWELLNHAKYRRMASLADQRDSNAKRQQRHRDRNANVTRSNASVTVETDIAEAEAEAEADTKVIPPTPPPTPPLPPEPPRETAFDQFWKVYPKKIAKDDARKAWAKRKLDPLLPQIIQAVAAQKSSADWKKDGGQFIPHPATWLNSGRWEDELKIDITTGSGPNRNTGTANEHAKFDMHQFDSLHPDEPAPF